LASVSAIPATIGEEEAMMRTTGYLSALAGLALAGLASAGAVAADPVGIGADIAKMCGAKPLRVALIDGHGGDTWRKISLAEFRDEAAKCANIKEVIYMDTSGDQQKYNGAINSLVAQNVDVIVAMPDFGEASIPTFRSALKAGVTVIPYFGVVKGEAGRDYSANVVDDQTDNGALWAEWLGANLKKGNILFYGGFPGGANSVAFFDALKAGLKKYPDIKLLDNNFIVTHQSAGDAQKATAAAIATYPKIDAIVTDYGVTALAAVRAFQAAGLPVPAIATIASSVELNCRYLSDKAAGKPWPYFSIDGLNRLTRYALRRGVAISEGTENTEPTAVKFPAFADSFAGIDPKCDPSAPPDADLSSSLSAEALAKILKQ
jgi:ribose transport system substrate-binding protein